MSISPTLLILLISIRVLKRSSNRTHSTFWKEQSAHSTPAGSARFPGGARGGLGQGHAQKPRGLKHQCACVSLCEARDVAAGPTSRAGDSAAHAGPLGWRPSSPMASESHCAGRTRGHGGSRSSWSPYRKHITTANPDLEAVPESTEAGDGGRRAREREQLRTPSRCAGHEFPGRLCGAWWGTGV